MDNSQFTIVGVLDKKLHPQVLPNLQLYTLGSTEFPRSTYGRLLLFCRICRSTFVRLLPKGCKNSAAALYTGVCNSHCRKATKTARITTFFQWWELQIPIFLHSRIANSTELEDVVSASIYSHRTNNEIPIQLSCQTGILVLKSLFKVRKHPFSRRF